MNENHLKYSRLVFLLRSRGKWKDENGGGEINRKTHSRVVVGEKFIIKCENRMTNRQFTDR